jgi:hypothetical protein
MKMPYRAPLQPEHAAPKAKPAQPLKIPDPAGTGVQEVDLIALEFAMARRAADK